MDMDTVLSQQAVMHNLFKFQKSGYLCDTVIITDDGHLKAHSAVLAAASPVFKLALKGDGIVKEHVILLPGVSIDVAEALVQCVYCGKAVQNCSNSAVLETYKELGISRLLPHQLNRLVFQVVSLCHREICAMSSISLVTCK